MMKWRVSGTGKWHITSRHTDYPLCNDRPMNANKRLRGQAYETPQGKDICKKCAKSAGYNN